MSKFSNSSIIEKLPDNHFGQISDTVVNCLLNGQCATVYGIPGYGMDYFAKYTVLKINKIDPKVKVILLNLDLENDKTEVFKRELKRIIGIKEIDEIVISEYLKDNKIVVVLTEVYHPEYPQLFRYLRALREQNQQNFTVFTALNWTILKNSNDYLKYGKQIFFNVYRLSNFDLKGVRRIIRINNEQLNWGISLDLSKKIYFLSGGNPGLVRNICLAVFNQGEEILNNPKSLIKFPALKFRLFEIAELVTKLSIEEQIELGILNSNGKLFAELLTVYLRETEIGVLDKLFPDLTKTDRRILGVFIQNPGVTIDKDQLSLILDQTADTYSEWAIYKAVARVRKKIRDKYKIKTLKGKGWRLEDNE